MASEGLTGRPLIAVVGPTATGKTRLALDLARHVGGEILSADMGQLYRFLDAGTAKPNGKWIKKRGALVYEVESVSYHLVDFLDPRQETDAGTYARLARPILEDIRQRGRQPILAGGTGLYIKALIEGLDPLPPRDPELRRKLGELAERKGRQWLHDELRKRDPDSALRIPAGNVHRVVRALEILDLTGRTASELRGNDRPASEPAVYLGIEWGAAALRKRIRARAESMFPEMLREAAALVPARYAGTEPGFRCLGYPEVLACLRGDLSRAEALERMVRKTAAYAKRQRTWFRRQTPVRWLKPGVRAADIQLWNE